MIYTEHRRYYQFENDNANLLIAIENKPGGKCFRPSLCRVYYSSSFANRRRIFYLRSCILAVSELYWRCDSKKTPVPTYQLVSKSPFCIMSRQEEVYRRASCVDCSYDSSTTSSNNSREKKSRAVVAFVEEKKKGEEERRMMDDVVLPCVIKHE